MIYIKDASGSNTLFTFDGYDLDIDNEFSTGNLDSNYSMTLGGMMHISQQVLKSGQKLVLAGQAWVERQNMETLFNLANQVNTAYQLVIGSNAYTVIFDHSQNAPISAEALVPRPNHADTDIYQVTRINFRRI